MTIDPNWRKRPRYWTDERLLELDELLSQGLTDAAIAARMGKTVASIRLARRRRLKRPRSHYVLTGRQVAELLGFGCAKKVRELVRRRALHAQRGERRGPYQQWHVRYEDLLAFLDDPAWWPWWEPERITEPNLRATYQEIRRERYLPLSEVAARYFVEPKTVYRWITKGWLPAVRHGRGNHLIPASVLVGWQPPSWQSRRGRRRSWTPEREGLLLRLRAQGWTWREVGAALGVSEKAAKAHGGYLRRLEREQRRAA